MAKRELLATIRDRYRSSSKKDNSRILDEFIAVIGHNRKHGIRLIGELDNDQDTTHSLRGRRIYDEAVPILAKEQSLVTAGLEAIEQRLPFPIRGIDSDNDARSSTRH